MKVATRIVFFAALFIILVDCVNRKTEEPGSLVLNMYWNKAYAAETKDTVNTGLLWAFSFLGAELKTGSFNRAVQWTDSCHLRVDLAELGFGETARQALAAIAENIRSSEEYTTHHAVDLGRFIVLTLNTPQNYYAITGVEKNYQAFRASFRFDPRHTGLTKSSISVGHRLIEMPIVTDVKSIGYVAKEGTGSLADRTFSVKEYEVFDIMPNGQLRFAIYNEQGQLQEAANVAVSRGGKPAKCLWCHEININPAFAACDSVPGHYDHKGFSERVFGSRRIVEQYRQQLQSDVDYTRRQDHTLTELLYISFMEPSAERLAQEWNMSLATVREKLSGLNAHHHHEFPFLGELYHRKDIDALAPYSVVWVPESAREIALE